MKKLSTLLLAASLALSGLAVQAADQADTKTTAKKPLTAQQEKMKVCNADAKAKELKGDERKAFMKTCLSNKKEPDQQAKQETGQQQKMKACNAEAKDKSLKGDKRKAFIKECLSGAKPTA